MKDSIRRTTVGIHFFYVGLILGLTIILLVTFEWTSLAGFTEYLSVAATLTSLVLGILAIIYGFVSNGSINQSLGSVETASLRMGQIASDFQALANSSNAIQEKAEKRTERLHELIEDMQLGLSTLASTTEKIAGSVDALPDRINNAQKAGPSEPEVLDSRAEDAAQPVTENQYVKFARKTSPLGLLAVYAALKAYESDRYIDFLRLVGEKNSDYAWGFMIAAASTDLLDLDYPGAKRSLRALRLKEPDERLSRAIMDAWEAAPKSKKAARRSVVKRFGAAVEGAMVDSEPEEE